MTTAFAPPAVNSETSIASASAIAPVSGTLRAVVLEAIKGYGDTGATDEDLQWMLSMNPSTQRPRRIELVNAKLVKDSGKTRKTSSGRQATVWVAI